MSKLLDLTLVFIMNNTKLDNDNREIIRYGLEILFIKIVFSMCALLIAFSLHCFRECIVFLIAFSAIRTSAGGYHAKTRIQCFVMSMFMIIINIGAVKLVAHYISLYYYLAPLALISVVAIWFLSPVDTENRPLDVDEKIRFKRRTRIILCLEIVLVFLLEILTLRNITVVLLLATSFVAVLLIMELIVKRKNNE